MPDTSLQDLLSALRSSQAMADKARAGLWAAPFTHGRGRGIDCLGPGDDAGAVALEGGGYLLLSAEGIWPPLLDDPEFAGFCSVTVNVNDVSAMGGSPIGLVSVVFEGDVTDGARESFLRGMRDALEHYSIPMLGGHTSPAPGPLRIAVAIAGKAERLLRGDGAVHGDTVLAAFDLNGEQHAPFHAWDSVRKADPRTTKERLDVLREVASEGLATACRDISNPGLLGTLAMMCEASGCGARVDLDAVPTPDGIEAGWWLSAYPSYGFLLATLGENAARVISLFEARGVECAAIGQMREGSEVIVGRNGDSAVFIDWREVPITGIFD